MTPDRETDITNIHSLIRMWRDEEQRLRSIIEDSQSTPLVKNRAKEKLDSVLNDIRALADELDMLELIG